MFSMHFHLDIELANTSSKNVAKMSPWLRIIDSCENMGGFSVFFLLRDRGGMFVRCLGELVSYRSQWNRWYSISVFCWLSSFMLCVN